MYKNSNIDYQELCASFKWDRPTHYNFATDVIDRWASADPDKLAIFWIDDNVNLQTRSHHRLSKQTRNNHPRRHRRDLL